MRLICPNCGAQYEVPDDAIPPQGRDVQCSNCAHTWLERPGASMAAEHDGDGAAPDESDQSPETAPDRAPEHATAEADGVAETAPPPAAVAKAAVGDESPPSEDTDATPEEAAQDPGPPPVATPVAAIASGAARAPVRQALSSSITEILREEAAREEAARRTEAETAAQSQPDLGLDRPVDREDQLAEEVRRRMARMKGEAAPAISAPVTQTSGARSELLPDIEEINSSLRSSAHRAVAEPEPEQEEAVAAGNKRGARFGFTLMLLLFALLALLYVFAPRISAAVPQAAPALTRYVETVDQGRLWLDMQVQSLLAMTDEGAPEAGEPAAAVPDAGLPDAGAAPQPDTAAPEAPVEPEAPAASN